MKISLCIILMPELSEIYIEGFKQHFRETTVNHQKVLYTVFHLLLSSTSIQFIVIEIAVKIRIGLVIKFWSDLKLMYYEFKLL